MKINRNMSAVRQIRPRYRKRLSKSMKRLSSGYKINSAEDNPQNGYLQQDEGADRSA